MLDVLNLPGIRPVDLRSEHGVITIVAEVLGEDIPACPLCGNPLYRHGHRAICFADTPLQMQPARLEIDRPRYRCGSCRKTLTKELPFVDERRRATKRLIEAIRRRCLTNTFHSLAEETGLAVNTVKNIALDLISELEKTVRFQTPVIMGIAEVNLAGDCRCVITNLATNSVFDMLKEYTKASMKRFFRDLADRHRVEWVCTDIWRPFKDCLGLYLPNARLVINKSHVARIAADALEVEKKRHQVTLDWDGRPEVKKSIRWLTLKRPASLSEAERRALDGMREHFPRLAEAYDFKESFYRIYDEPDKASALRAFEAWQNSLPSGRLPAFHSLSRTVRNHLEDIFAYWDAPVRITNAYAEGFEGLVKVANRMGRGYSYEIIRAKTLYANQVRLVGSGARPEIGARARPTKAAASLVEYGPYIPALVGLSEGSELG